MAQPDPRSQPRYLTNDPDRFGKRPSITWVPAKARDPAELLTAQLQHGVAVAVRQALRRNGWTVVVLAERTVLGPGTLGKILRGQQQMTLAHLAELHLALAPEGFDLAEAIGSLTHGRGSSSSSGPARQ